MELNDGLKCILGKEECDCSVLWIWFVNINLLNCVLLFIQSNESSLEVDHFNCMGCEIIVFKLLAGLSLE